MRQSRKFENKNLQTTLFLPASSLQLRFLLSELIHKNFQVAANLCSTLCPQEKSSFHPLWDATVIPLPRSLSMGWLLGPRWDCAFIYSTLLKAGRFCPRGVFACPAIINSITTSLQGQLPILCWENTENKEMNPLIHSTVGMNVFRKLFPYFVLEHELSRMK